jgi:hypothetical protein
MTIKISQLGNLTSFTGNTIFPVVDTANAYITVKSTGATLLNYISGNLTSLRINGNITTNGNITANAGYLFGNGSQLTGMNQYSNVQVATYLPTYIGSISASTVTAQSFVVSNSLVITGNISAANVLSSGYYFADGAAITVGANLKISNAYVPTSNSSVGTSGQLAYDNSYFYVCINTNTWRRANLSTW